MTTRFRLWLAIVPALCLAFSTMAGGVSVEHLRCEYLENPLGIDTPQPRLSWIIESRERGQRQTAFQVLVAPTKGNLEPSSPELVWDSGKVESAESVGVAYGGKALASGKRYFWKVRVWDKDGRVSDWSEAAFFEMGLLDEKDWKGQWIARTTDTNSNPAPLLRRAFTLKERVKEARAYICGLGYYELHINGKKIGDHLLDPAFTRYDKRVLYVTYDVTEALRRGKNAVGVMLGNGWYNVHTKAVWDFHNAPWRAAPKLLMQLRVEYSDGRSETIVTDGQWKTSTGPVTFDSIYSGETYDARLEKAGWDTADYNDSGWDAAKMVEGPKGTLRAQMMEPIKVDRVIKPVKLSEPKPGVFVFDMGQNFAGFAELSVFGGALAPSLSTVEWERGTGLARIPKPPNRVGRGEGRAGARVVMRYSERLGTNGMIDREEIQKHVLKLDTNQQFQTDTYILKGDGRESWHSRFTYHGFQYVEVTGFPGKPTLDSLRGVFIHSAVPVAGEFECSNPLLNKIWQASRWSFLSNLQGIPTDCPHREKNGWTGDAHLAAEQGLFNYAPAAVYTKWINDLGDEQRPGGELPGIVPTSGWGYKWGNGPAWDSAFLLIPYYLYEYCQDTEILRQHYEGMKRYVDYLTSKATNGIVSIGLNDWAPFETKTPGEITSTAYYYRDAQIVALAAKLSGNESEAQKYADLAESIRKAFNDKFFNRETGIYGNGSQTALSCALYQGLVEDSQKARVVSNLVAAVEKRNGHIDTGILGAKYLMNALLENGQVELAYRIATQKEQPGWGWWMEQGATTLWEQWNGNESRNHIMFGDVVAWFYKALAGINPDPAAPGFKHVIIRPNVVGDLTYAKASYDSVRGRIVSEWRIVNGRFHLEVIIPANATGTVYLPSKYSGEVKEGGKAPDKVEGVKALGIEDGRAVFRVGSGVYHFEAEPTPKS